MTSPNFENIDLWLFDYTEGNLSVYQKELLENYILNHPELEIDLDMWNMAKVPVAETIDHSIEIKKKREYRFAYYATSLIGAVIILLIGKTHEQYNLNTNLNNTSQISQIENTSGVNKRIINKPKLQNKNPKEASENSKNTPSEIQISTARANASIMSTSVNITRKQRGCESVNHSTKSYSEILLTGSSKKEWQDQEEHVSSLIPFALPLQPKGVLNNIRYSNAESIETADASKSKSLGLSGIRLNTKTLFNKIDRVLSKSIAFSNYRDHFYIIPGIASNNINLSATGSTSQTRFISTSRTRWLGTNKEKISQELSLDGYARSIRSGVGAQMSYDSYADGTIKDWNASFIFSPKIALSKNISFEPATKLRIGNKILDADKVENNTVSLYNSNNPQVFDYDTSQNIGRKLWYRDLDAGFTINTKVLYIGFQAENILNHVENLYQNQQNSENSIPTTYSVLAGTQYLSRNEKISFHPYLYMRSNVNRTSYYSGFSLDLDKLFIGASIGSNDEYSGALGLSLDRFALLIQTTRAHQEQLNQNLFTHQLTLRVNSLMSKKTRRYITL